MIIWSIRINRWKLFLESDLGGGFELFIGSGLLSYNVE